MRRSIGSVDERLDPPTAARRFPRASSLDEVRNSEVHAHIGATSRNESNKFPIELFLQPLGIRGALALLGAGLDPTLGVLHADQRNRDSFALDAMEPVRPIVDAFVLDLLEERVLTSRDFVELPNGVCRVRAPMTHDLALTLPRWRQSMAPVVADLALQFRNAMARPVAAINAMPAESLRAKAKPAPKISTLAAMPRKPRPQRPYASKVWSAPRPEPLLINPNTCVRCGESVVKRRRKHCDRCIPSVREEHARNIVSSARATLAKEHASGRDPRSTPEANRKRGLANSEHHRKNRNWKRDNPDDARDLEYFQTQILPRLDAHTLTEIAKATGVSLAASSRFRSGRQIPHRRHWTPLEDLIKENTSNAD